MRYLSLIAVALAAALLAAGCGGSKDQPKAALGTPQNPMVARAQGPSPTAPTPAARRRAKALAAASAAATSGRAAPSSSSSPTPIASSKTTKAAEKAAAAAQGEPTSGSGAAAPAPNYQDLPAQKAAPSGRTFSPCNLVSQARAETILGGSIQAPLEAPQGPTCIYRSKNGKSFVTLAVQQVTYAKLKVRKARAASVSGHAAYCASLGHPMFYVPLHGARVLTISAPCKVAQAFAQTAVTKLAS
jgi:hypothetical protein